MRNKGKKMPDWEGDRYWGELTLYHCPGLYGQPIYYTDGAKIPYDIVIPKVKEISVEELIGD